MGFIPAMKVIHHFIHHINILTEWGGNQMVISIGEGKSFENIEHSLMIKKNSQQTRNRRNFLNPIKGSDGKPTANMIYLSGKINAFPIR